MKSEYIKQLSDKLKGHPPHGGCGLKSFAVNKVEYKEDVTLHTEGVD